MVNDLESFKAELKVAIDDCSRFCYATRDRESQIEAVERLETLKAKANVLKAEAITAEDEDSANQLLSLENMVQGLVSELQMWVDLKDDNPNAAWNALMNAQSSIRTAMQAHDLASYLAPLVERLYALEQLLFPPQIFFSAGMVIRQSSCSICGREYGDCEHVKGRVYMGRMCAREIREAEVREVSVVDSPASKLCRAFIISDEGITRDVMTWRPVTSTGENPEDMLRHHLITTSKDE